jgi:uncharacterized membrane protein SpoIIM required for sporulation
MWNQPNSGLIVVALASLAAIPFVYNLFNSDASAYEEDTFFGSSTLARHLPVIVVLMALFVGMVAGFTAWYLYLPPADAARVFDVQVNEIKAVQQSFQGKAIAFNDAAQRAFETIFLHNLQVLFLIIVLSLLYGSGAVLILAWNAAVIGVFLGTLAINLAGTGGGDPSIFTGLSVGVLGILPHGTFELLSYVTAALAGGILSSAFIRSAHLRSGFVIVVYDVAKLLAVATLFLAIGAGIESQAFA